MDCPEKCAGRTLSPTPIPPTASPSTAPTHSPTGTCNGIPDPEICAHFDAGDCGIGLGLELYCFYLCDTCVVFPTDVPTPDLTESPTTSPATSVPTISPTGTCNGRPDAPICALYDNCDAGLGLEQYCLYLCGTCVTTTTVAPTAAPAADPLLLARGPCLMRPLDLVVVAHLTEAMVVEGAGVVAQTFVRGLFRSAPFAPYGVRTGLVSNIVDVGTNTTVGIGLAEGDGRIEALSSLVDTGSWSGSVRITRGSLQDTLGKIADLALHDRRPPVVSMPPGCSPDTASVCSTFLLSAFTCSTFQSVAAACPTSCGTCEPPVVEQCRGNYLRFQAGYTGRHRCRCGPDCHFCAHNGTSPGRCTKVRGVSSFLFWFFWVVATLDGRNTMCQCVPIDVVLRLRCSVLLFCFAVVCI